jgi:type IV pilus assembly protein PilY1
LGGSIFALDVTDPTSMTAQKVLWDLTGADNDDIGHILQPGVIGSAKDGNWYYFVGNGYESQNDKARLLAINLSTGNVLSLATDDAGGSDPADSDLLKRPNGLGGVTPVYDRNRNIVAIYAGDRLGRLGKFDRSAATSATELAAVTGTKLFEARDGSTATALRQPITAAPRVMEHPFGGRYIAFGTGKFFERLDRDDLSVQSIYVLWEKNPSSPAEIARSSLRELTLAGDGRTADTDGQCTASDGARVGRVLGGQGSIDFTTDLGFYFDLIVGTETTGERVLVTPVEDAGFVNFSTFEPLAGGDACAGGGRSFAYRLDLAGGFTRAAFADRNKQCVAFSLQEATVGNQALLGTPVSGSGCTGDDCPGPTRVLKRAGLEKMLETLSPHLLNASSAGVGSGIRSGLTGTVGFGSPNNSLRVWRELPRE